ncbi:DUF6562 domain-containing protein [Bacteroides eggerthii]|jgi:hypothetical protein|uniref:DUF6562 domain-containing protein n=1 Tax=Bacteroides eggerthii TaxID=28111 RepID=A0A7X9XI27_9BACE|nr:DUF6562 domain-containing protein [Bacteroides eggerthii]NME85846.1 hypothetical protein [Bacteroides eggerthii]
MKQKYAIGFIALVMATLFVSCVHDYPGMTEEGEEGVDPTLVEVNTEVTLDLELVPLEIITQESARSGTNKARSGTTKADDGYRRRFIIEAWREGKPTARQVTVMETAEEDGDGKISLPIHLKLHALEYTLAVWTDYVKAGTTDDLYYDTDNLQQVACTDPYTGSTPYRDCLYGTAPLDLRQYRDEWNAKVQIKVDMVRPLAKYELIATDVKDFLRKTKKQRADDETFTITFSYGFYLPTVFNVLTGKPADSRTGIAYTTPLTVPTDGQKECTIGTDFVFVNGTESFVSLSMEIRDGGGNVISRTTGLEVPYRRGHLTTVRARFLTNEMQGGVDIDDDFDGNIDVDLDGLLH